MAAGAAVMVPALSPPARPRPVNDLVIAPSILSADFARLGTRCAMWPRPGPTGSTSTSWTATSSPTSHSDRTSVRALRPHADRVFDVHLMIAPCDPFLEAFAEAGADVITVTRRPAPTCIARSRRSEPGQAGGRRPQPRDAGRCHRPRPGRHRPRAGHGREPRLRRAVLHPGDGRQGGGGRGADRGAPDPAGGRRGRRAGDRRAFSRAPEPIRSSPAPPCSGAAERLTQPTSRR
jgi:hypothetical protein